MLCADIVFYNCGACSQAAKFIFIYVSLVGLFPSNGLFYLNNQGRQHHVWQLWKMNARKQVHKFQCTNGTWRFLITKYIEYPYILLHKVYS